MATKQTNEKVEFFILFWKVTILIKYSLKVLFETDIILLVGKYLVLGNFSGHNTFSKIVALIVKEGQIRLEVDKVI